jgi:hypothetical protein
MILVSQARRRGLQGSLLAGEERSEPKRVHSQLLRQTKEVSGRGWIRPLSEGSDCTITARDTGRRCYNQRRHREDSGVATLNNKIPTVQDNN